MAPARPALAQSESKARFFERLGLDDNNELHRRIYAMMKEEAVEAFKRLTENREALVLELRHTGLEPPFSHAQISETAIHREILNMYYRARPETRVIYDLAHDRERLEEENWVVRWLLWHVFRYRDNRNRNRRGPSNGGPGEDDDDDDDTESGDGSANTGGSLTKCELLRQVRDVVTGMRALADIRTSIYRRNLNYTLLGSCEERLMLLRTSAIPHTAVLPIPAAAVYPVTKLTIPHSSTAGFKVVR
ncbi:hypothetical protein LTR29_007972 [Friedmanniomyces endolithicus]|nr:hypothetical protein LTR29_007972 [Friedmanniomyces endolithicus]